MTRSEMMSRMGTKDTAPELVVRRGLHARGYRFALHRKNLPGKPDVVLPKYKAALFIHGCFWHMHRGCSYFKMPRTRVDFWTEKLGRNQERDRSAREDLLRLGWRVLTVWECETRKSAGDGVVDEIIKWLESDLVIGEIPSQP